MSRSLRARTDKLERRGGGVVLIAGGDDTEVEARFAAHLEAHPNDSRTALLIVTGISSEQS